MTFEIFEFCEILDFFKIFRKSKKQVWKFLKDEKNAIDGFKKLNISRLGDFGGKQTTKKQKKTIT